MRAVFALIMELPASSTMTLMSNLRSENVVYICIRAIRSPETGDNLGMGDKVVGTLIT